MKKYLLFTPLLFVILSFGFTHAQEGAVAYISFLAGNVDVDYTPDNGVEDFEIAELDMRLPQGSIIRTGREGLCEVTMPDGSTIKISSKSVFEIGEFYYDGAMEKKRGKFNLIFGRVRAKVSKLMTADSEFEIKSGTSLAGVRGTNFGILFDGETSQIFVFDGTIVLKSETGAFEPIIIEEGQLGTVLGDGLLESVVEIPPELLAEWEQELQKFGEEAEEIAEVVEPEEPEKEVKKARGDFFSKYFSMTATFGSLTVDDTFYNRWVLIPEIKAGKFGLGLYIPAIFAPDGGLFQFEDWENHDEWNFTDLEDGIHDFFIKIYYLRYGSLGDPLYFRLGSIDDFFLGHGFIVDNYSNMLFFPEELFTGFQFNADGNRIGIETMVSRFSGLQTFGGRLYLRPLGRNVPFAFGATVVHDKPKPSRNVWPIGPLGEATENKDQLPRILVFGADAEFPIARLDRFTMKLYGDAAKLGYLYDELHPALENTDASEGKIEFVKGLGTAVGLMGKIASMFNYRVEYRYLIDYYEPGLINFRWDNRRPGYPQELLNLILAQNDPSYDSRDAAGFLISGGVELYQKLEFGLGYENYKKITGAGKESVEEARAYVNVMKGLVPRIYGNLSYDRSENLENIFSDPFDENTLLEANIFYEFAPNFTLSLNVKRTFRFNDRTAQNESIDSYGISTIFTF